MIRASLAKTSLRTAVRIRALSSVALKLVALKLRSMVGASMLGEAQGKVGTSCVMRGRSDIDDSGSSVPLFSSVESRDTSELQVKLWDEEFSFSAFALAYKLRLASLASTEQASPETAILPWLKLTIGRMIS